MATKIWARIENGAVVELTPPLDDSLVPGRDLYAPSLTFADATGVAGVTAGWTYANGSFAAPATAAPTVAQLLQYANDRQNRLLTRVWAFNANAGTQDAALWLTTRLDAAGQASMLQLMVWSGVTGDGDTEPYSNVDFTSVNITPTQARSLALQAGQAKSGTYAALNAVTSAILAQPPTITAFAQIDQYQWPVPGTVPA